jgi:hypothetical protein
MRPIDHTLIFYLVSMMGVLGLWFFKRSWLEQKPGKSVVEKASILLAITGVIGWFTLRSRLEFLMLLFPIAQFYAYSYMFAVFHRKYHRSPTLPSLANVEGAEFPDQVFNFIFLGIAAFIPFICGGIILMKMNSNI